MQVTTDFFDVLQFSINILQFPDREDFDNLDNGLATIFDNLHQKLYGTTKQSLLIAEANGINPQSVWDTLVQMNKSQCALNNSKSFLDIPDESLWNLLKDIEMKHPIYREYTNTLDRGGKWDKSIIPQVEAKAVIEFFLEMRNELLLAYRQPLMNGAIQPILSQSSLVLPDNLNTDRARKYFARAVEFGYMESTATGYQWLFGGLAQLGYFVERVFCPNNTEHLPEQDINRLFGVNRIGSAISQVHNAKKPQKWRADIDKLFDD